MRLGLRPIGSRAQLVLLEVSTAGRGRLDNLRFILRVGGARVNGSGMTDGCIDWCSALSGTIPLVHFLFRLRRFQKSGSTNQTYVRPKLAGSKSLKACQAPCSGYHRGGENGVQGRIDMQMVSSVGGHREKPCNGEAGIEWSSADVPHAAVPEGRPSSVGCYIRVTDARVFDSVRSETRAPCILHFRLDHSPWDPLFFLRSCWRLPRRPTLRSMEPLSALRLA